MVVEIHHLCVRHDDGIDAFDDAGRFICRALPGQKSMFQGMIFIHHFVEMGMKLVGQSAVAILIALQRQPLIAAGLEFNIHIQAFCAWVGIVEGHHIGKRGDL